MREHGVEESENQSARAFTQNLVETGFLNESTAVQLVALFKRARYADEKQLTHEDAFKARGILEETIRSARRMDQQAQRDIKG